MTFPKVHPALDRALEERGYREATPVQAEVLGASAAGRDLLVSAQTGSGKTVAYGLAVASDLLRDLAPRAGGPLALVVAPTRELALQVERELAWLYAHSGLVVASCVGGMDVRREVRALARGAHVVVGTPGRLCDHLRRGHLVLSRLRVLVLDEGDEMLDLGFREELTLLLDATPKERRTLLFSATLPPPVVTLARQHQREAMRIAVSKEDEAHGDIAYVAMAIAPHDRDHAVVNVLRWFEAKGALVFCRTRESVKHLHGNLMERGFPVVALSGELSQSERTRALQALRDGRARACVATDVAARGLDLPDLGLVVHADLPNDSQVLLHRSGRTGRAGRKGTCVLLVPSVRRRTAEQLLHQAKVRATWMPPPSAHDVHAKDRERMLSELTAVAASLAPDEVAAGRALLADLGAEAVAGALVKLTRAALPAPEELDAVFEHRRPHREHDRPRGPKPFRKKWKGKKG